MRSLLASEGIGDASCETPGVAPAGHDDDPQSVLSLSEGGETLTLTVRHCARRWAG